MEVSEGRNEKKMRGEKEQRTRHERRKVKKTDRQATRGKLGEGEKKTNGRERRGNGRR